ncbi:MAG: zinc-ribbon domain-containing protein [Lachnospiraceae bacterium]|nr:zinc-ribbon domain-containing protein [Lachnospiraceae bacterium]
MSKVRFCDQCGCELSEESKFCPNCGAKLAGINTNMSNYGNSYNDSATKQPKRKSRMPIILIVVILMVAAVGFGAYSEMKGGPGKAVETLVDLLSGNGGSKSVNSLEETDDKAENETVNETANEAVSETAIEAVNETASEIANEIANETEERTVAITPSAENQAVYEKYKTVIDQEIDDFVSTGLNTITLSVSGNNEHKPEAAIWGENNISCYSSDESVVTVSSGGKVTAVGEGSAYVVIIGSVGTLYISESYKYVVTS